MPRRVTFGELGGIKAYSLGQDMGWARRFEGDLEILVSRSKGGARQHRRPAYCSDGSKAGRRASRRNGIARRGVEEWQYDIRRLQRQHGPSTPKFA